MQVVEVVVQPEELLEQAGQVLVAMVLTLVMAQTELLILVVAVAVLVQEELVEQAAQAAQA